MRDYLSVLMPLLREGSVRHKGDFYQVDGGFVVPGTSPVPVLVGALSSLMVEVAGELADGVVTWLAGRAALVSTSSRGCRQRPRAASAAGRGGAAGGGLRRCRPSQARRRRDVQPVCRLDNYRRQLEREGAASPGGLAITGRRGRGRQAAAAAADLGRHRILANHLPRR